MSCSSPILAVKRGINSEGKNLVKCFGRSGGAMDYKEACSKFGKDNVMFLPCGKCDNCIEARTKAWAARCVLEASLYDQNAFITLTYSNNCLPKFGLCKRDLQDFIKRLRARYPGKEIRYFACGEYGSKTFRPHYHAIIFNWFPEDAKLLKPGNFEGAIYTSQILRDLWPFGHSSVGEVSYMSCGYVARYCLKKLKHNVGKYKEFNLMSLKPGIGARYFEQHYKDIYELDKIYFNFGGNYSAMPFRYFDKLLGEHDPELYEQVKNARISRANTNIADSLIKHGFTYAEQVLKYKGDLKTEHLKKLERNGDL